jgi:hypothetical protein
MKTYTLINPFHSHTKTTYATAADLVKALKSLEITRPEWGIALIQNLQGYTVTWVEFCKRYRISAKIQKHYE